MILASVLSLSIACATPAHPASSSTIAPVPPDAPVRVAGDPDSLAVALHREGATWTSFREAIRARKAGWEEIIGRAEVDASLVARARAVGGSWRIVAVAVDRCGDSMNSLPYVAALADSVPALSLRVVLPNAGSALQDAYRSLDGRRATPTFVLLDADGHAAGCVVELPQTLREWSHDARTRGVSSDELHTYQRTWYEANRGVGITTEFVELLEAARAGSPRCARGEQAR